MSKQPWATLRNPPEKQRSLQQKKEEAGVQNDEEKKSFSERVHPDDFALKFAFGSIVGVTTGGCFGAVDGLNLAKTKSPMQLVKEGGKGQFVLASAARTGFMFAGFYGVYQGSKFLISKARNKEDLGNAVAATAISLSPMFFFPSFRSRFHYAAMLIAMDVVQTEIIDKM
mmetsp:Transcript_31934/g.50117  ORF Transcript_31934/g.50117 Transcript_31934/m.50117 type:complete len:170 (+) Transcript_31934:28-537(+)